MKPILSYYGGKQKMVQHILPLIPEHSIYVEPFAGGASVFFTKELAKVNILNDIFGELVFFYRYVQNNKDEFIKKIETYPYARSVHKDFMKRKDLDGVERAIALYYLINCSFVKGYRNGFATGIEHNLAKTYQNRLHRLNEQIELLKNALIEDLDAIECIRRYDSEDTFFYIDSPYLNCKQGYYSKYTESNFKDLLNILKTVKGKYILSTYPYNGLEEYGEVVSFTKQLCAKKDRINAIKTEVLVVKV